jgi:carbon-monoxide dehydrogenase medium subunit
MWERYFAVQDLEQAIALLSEQGQQARIVAGATDLLLELERGARPGVTALIDISRVPGQDRIELDERGWIRLGPLVTHNHCALSPLTRQQAYALARACWEVGSPQIRNRATVAGNLITASPANDSITPLMALGAEVTLRSAQRERSVPLQDFYTGVRRTVIRPDELLTSIAFPAPPPGSRSTFIKLGLRRAQAISLVNAAVVLQMDGERVRRAAITLGAVAPTIIHAEAAQASLEGRALDPAAIAEAAALAQAAASPIDDLRSSARYRSEMVRVCVLRALRDLAAGREKHGYPERPVALWGAQEPHRTSALAERTEHDPEQTIETTVNGRSFRFATGQHKSLLRLLREEGGLTGTKEGCAEGECGACTVLLDGMAVMACMVPAPRAHGAQIVTVEGLATDGKLHPIQQGFIDAGAVQCGYCTPGFLMSGAGLLLERPRPTPDEIRQSVTGNLCRCTGYYSIFQAFERAARLAEQAKHPEPTTSTARGG